MISLVIHGGQIMKKTVIQARIEEDYKKELQEIAETYGFSISSLLRLVIIGIVKSKGLAIKDFITLAPNKGIIKNPIK